MLAVALGALVLHMENVTCFLDEDYLHHLVSDLGAYLLLSGMVPIGCWRLIDAKLAGASGREGVFLRWEQEEMASCLPPLRAPPGELPPGKVLDFLDPPELVSCLVVGGLSVFEECGNFSISSTKATQVGIMWL